MSTITTEDCKALLTQDKPLIALGGGDEKGWKRISKKTGTQGIERVFSHPASGFFARVIESTNSTLSISAIATSISDLDDPSNQRKAKSVTTNVSSYSISSLFGEVLNSPSESEIPSINLDATEISEPVDQSIWPTICTNFIKLKKAENMLRSFIEDDEGAEKLWDKVPKLDPIALANQCTFCICNSDDGLVAIVTPTFYWLSNEFCYDQEIPMEHCFPPDSDDLNGCGTWLIPGFDEPVTLALELLKRGFILDEKFQEFIDAPTVQTLAPIFEKRALQAAVPTSLASSKASSRI